MKVSKFIKDLEKLITLNDKEIGILEIDKESGKAKIIDSIDFIKFTSIDQNMILETDVMPDYLIKVRK